MPLLMEAARGGREDWALILLGVAGGERREWERRERERRAQQPGPGREPDGQPEQVPARLAPGRTQARLRSPVPQRPRLLFRAPPAKSLR